MLPSCHGVAKKGGIEAAHQRHKVIMTPGKSVIWITTRKVRICPVGYRRFLPLDTVYNYNPLPAELTPEEQAYIIECTSQYLGRVHTDSPSILNIWLSLVLLAMSEVQWTQPEHKDFSRLPVGWIRSLNDWIIAE